MFNWSTIIYSEPYLAALHPWATLHTPELYAALSYWAMQHPTELQCILFLRYNAPCELTCTLWATLHPPEQPHPTPILLINAAPYRAMLHLTELCCTSQSYAAPHRATLHPTKLRCTPQSYQHPVNYTAPYWATQHPASNDAPYWAMLYPVPHWASLYPTELPNNLRAALHPTELRCTPLSYGAQTLRKEMTNDNLIKQYPWSEVLDNL